MSSAYSFQALEPVVTVTTSYAHLGYDNRLTPNFRCEPIRL